MSVPLHLVQLTISGQGPVTKDPIKPLAIQIDPFRQVGLTCSATEVVKFARDGFDTRISEEKNFVAVVECANDSFVLSAALKAAEKCQREGAMLVLVQLPKNVEYDEGIFGFWQGWKDWWQNSKPIERWIVKLSKEINQVTPFDLRVPVLFLHHSPIQKLLSDRRNLNSIEVNSSFQKTFIDGTERSKLKLTVRVHQLLSEIECDTATIYNRFWDLIETESDSLTLDVDGCLQLLDERMALSNFPYYLAMMEAVQKKYPRKIRSKRIKAAFLRTINDYQWSSENIRNCKSLATELRDFFSNCLLDIDDFPDSILVWCFLDEVGFFVDNSLPSWQSIVQSQLHKNPSNFTLAVNKGLREKPRCFTNEHFRFIIRTASESLFRNFSEILPILRIDFYESLLPEIYPLISKLIDRLVSKCSLSSLSSIWTSFKDIPERYWNYSKEYFSAKVPNIVFKCQLIDIKNWIDLPVSNEIGRPTPAEWKDFLHMSAIDNNSMLPLLDLIALLEEKQLIQPFPLHQKLLEYTYKEGMLKLFQLFLKTLHTKVVYEKWDSLKTVFDDYSNKSPSYSSHVIDKENQPLLVMLTCLDSTSAVRGSEGQFQFLFRKFIHFYVKPLNRLDCGNSIFNLKNMNRSARNQICWLFSFVGITSKFYPLLRVTLHFKTFSLSSLTLQNL